jgi:hypothetical protein
VRKISALDFNGATHIHWSYLFPTLSATEWALSACCSLLVLVGVPSCLPTTYFNFKINEEKIQLANNMANSPVAQMKYYIRVIDED